uniref:Uncharacterized protein n=1 Tax=Anguilla anguilla TaxID=7936 RepID=A0A0E9VMG5_ANGAN
MSSTMTRKYDMGAIFFQLLGRQKLGISVILYVHCYAMPMPWINKFPNFVK